MQSGVVLSMEKSVIMVERADGLLGAEICRLAVALAQDVCGVLEQSGALSLYQDEPWIQGVEWVELERDGVMSCARIVDTLILCRQSLDDDIFLKDIHSCIEQYTTMTNAKRIILICNHASVVCHDKRQQQQLLGSTPIDILVQTPTIMYSPGYIELEAASRAYFERTGELCPPEHVMRVERVAMACLRLALEDDRHGFYSCEEIAVIGDAMMIQ